MSETITHFVTWYSIYEDFPDKLSRAQDQEKLVSAAVLELPFSLASCLFQNQFIATSRAQRTPMQKRAFTKPSLHRYPHSPVSVGAPGTPQLPINQSSSGGLTVSIPPSLFSSLPSYYSFCLSGMWFLHLTSFFL